MILFLAKLISVRYNFFIFYKDKVKGSYLSQRPQKKAENRRQKSGVRRQKRVGRLAKNRKRKGSRIQGVKWFSWNFFQNQSRQGVGKAKGPPTPLFHLLHRLFSILIPNS